MRKAIFNSRLVAMILALAMAFGTMPTNVLAQTVEEDYYYNYDYNYVYQPVIDEPVIEDDKPAVEEEKEEPVTENEEKEEEEEPIEEEPIVEEEKPVVEYTPLPLPLPLPDYSSYQSPDPTYRELLNLAIEEAQARVEYNYTPSSWAVFQLALTQAMAALADKDATQAELDTAKHNLLAAMEGLELYYADFILPEATAPAAIEKLENHNFDAITQNWAGNSTVTRNMAINAVISQVEELFSDTGIVFEAVEPVDFNAFDYGGVSAAYFYFYIVELNSRAGDNPLNVKFSINITVNHAPATALNLTTHTDSNFVLADSYMQFSAEILPLGIPQDVVWEVSGHPAAFLNANGLLTVSGVPHNTELTVTVTSYAEDLQGDTLSSSLVVTVVNEIIEWSGSGTASDPYLIATAAQLELLAYRVNSTRPFGAVFANTHFRLTADIQLDDSWEAIGTPFIARAWVNPNAHQGNSFNGIFDGAGHTISFAHGSLPLFGAILQHAQIRNLNIYGPYIAGHGLIAGVTVQVPFGTAQYPSIDNIRILSGTTIRGSGISGTDGFRPQHLHITNSTIEPGVRIGWSDHYNGPFDQNRNYFANTAGAGPGLGSFVSGLAGFIENSVSYATVYGHPNVRNVGGLVGYKQHSMRSFEISSSAFHGTIVAPESLHVGGILGGGYDAPNPRNATPTGQLGGMWGAPNTPGANISDTIVTATIIGYDYVGGIVGGEFANQMWSTGAIGGPQHIVERNRFEGRVETRRRGSRRSGAVFGYVRSLNRNNVISDNIYIAEEALSGLGVVSLVDTIYTDPSDAYYTTFFDSQGRAPGRIADFSGISRANYYRTDDTLGSGLYRLARSDANRTVLADKTALRAVIADARTRVASNYNPFNWPNKVAAYQHAVSVNNNASAAQSIVNAAANDLTNALEALEPYGLVRTVTIRVTDPHGRAFLAPIQKAINPGETAYELLNRLGLVIYSSGTTAATRYVTAINGWGEFSDGPLSGWLYAVNGRFPDFSAGLFTLNCGDHLKWLFTRDLGNDLVEYLRSLGYGVSGSIGPVRDALRYQIARFDALNLVEANYTRESWLAILEAFRHAEDVYDATAASQDIIDRAAEALRLAIDNRVLVGELPPLVYRPVVVELETIRDTIIQLLQANPDAEELVLSIETEEYASRVEAVLSVEAINLIVNSNLSLTIESAIAVITLDIETLAGLIYGKDSNLAITIIAEHVEDIGSLTVMQRRFIANSPVFSFKILLDEYAISDFDGIVTIRVPFNLPRASVSNSLLTVYHVSNYGQATEMANTAHISGEMTFTTTHFSVFTIRERTIPSPVEETNGSHWLHWHIMLIRSKIEIMFQ